MTTDDEKIVAVLHDVVEDTTVNLDVLRAHGFGPHIISAVDAIMKRPGESLAESMARVNAPPASIVKQADISHNADSERRKGLPDEARERLTAKYAESAQLLGTTLPGILAQHR